MAAEAAAGGMSSARPGAVPGRGRQAATAGRHGGAR